MSKAIAILTAVLLVFLFFSDFSLETSGLSKVEATGLSKKPHEAGIQKDAAPQISPVADLFDFGWVRQGDKVEHVFQVRNTGTADLVIKQARGD